MCLYTHSCNNSPQCCCTVIWAAQPGSCIVNSNSKMRAWCHLSPQQPCSSETTSGSSRCPQGPVKGFLFCHFIGNGKAISYTGNIWHSWIWISTYPSCSQWQRDFHCYAWRHRTYIPSVDSQWLEPNTCVKSRHHFDIVLDYFFPLLSNFDAFLGKPETSLLKIHSFWRKVLLYL